MMVDTAQLSESLQTLIDSRLDTIDRMLLAWISRQDRLAIVREVESQIHELLTERDTGELTREDVLAMLARLDPPEAYIPDEIDGERVLVNRNVATLTGRSVARNDAKVGKASGILGLTALALMLLLPVCYVIAVALDSSMVAIVLYVGNLLATVCASVLALTLGAYARKSGPWAIVGIVTSLLSLFLSLATVIVAILLGG
jgi:hypothetical protein